MIIFRYLSKEVVQTLLAVLVVLLLIFMGRYFGLYLGHASTGEISRDIVLDMLFLQTLTSLSVMIPFALFVAVLLAFGRLYKDSEMTAMTACGVNPSQVLKIVGLISLVCCLIVAILSFLTTPWAVERTLQVKEQAQGGTAFAAVAGGQFNEIGENGQEVFYVEDLSTDRQRLQDVFVQVFRDGKLDIVSARSGYQRIDPDTGDRYLVLVDGYRYQGLPGEADFRIHKFELNGVRLVERDVSPLRRKRSAIATTDLWQSGLAADQAELQWRIAMPLATLLLPVLGVMLSQTSPRQGRFAKLFVAILVFVSYYNALGVAMSWTEQGVVPEWLGMWWVHLVLVTLIIGLGVRHLGGYRYLLQRREFTETTQ